MSGGMAMNGWVAAAGALLVAGALWTDVRRMVIPNRWTIPFGAAGLVWHGWAGGWEGVAASAAGVGAGWALLFVLYLLRGVGGGDVKWFAAYGAWAGAGATAQLLIGSVLCGGAIAALLLLARAPALRRRAERVRWPWGPHPAAGRGARFPFMLAVAPAYALSLAW